MQSMICILHQRNTYVKCAMFDTVPDNLFGSTLPTLPTFPTLPTLSVSEDVITYGFY